MLSSFQRISYYAINYDTMFNFESGWDMKSLEPISLSGFPGKQAEINGYTSGRLHENWWLVCSNLKITSISRKVEEDRYNFSVVNRILVSDLVKYL